MVYLIVFILFVIITVVLLIFSSNCAFLSFNTIIIGALATLFVGSIGYFIKTMSLFFEKDKWHYDLLLRNKLENLYSFYGSIVECDFFLKTFENGSIEDLNLFFTYHSSVYKKHEHVSIYFKPETNLIFESFIENALLTYNRLLLRISGSNANYSVSSDNDFLSSYGEAVKALKPLLNPNPIFLKEEL